MSESHDAHDQHADEGGTADYPIPVSAGIAPQMRWFLVIAMLVVIMQGTFVVLASGFGRVFPSANSVKVPLH